MITAATRPGIFMKTTPPCTAALLTLALLLPGGSSQAQDSKAPPDFYAKLVVTSLGYLRDLAPLGEDVRVLAIHGDGLTSRTLASDIALALEDVGKPVAGKLPIAEATTKRYRGAAWLRTEIAEGSYDLVFVSEGLDASLPEIIAVTRETKTMSLAASAAMTRQGVTLSVALLNRRPRIFVNSTAAAAEGFTFKPGLLRRATVFE
jgi:hypothetical protein